jgi:HTH-type transcriptional regulator / antitoxin HigA
MITNERQYKITKSQLEKLIERKNAIESIQQIPANISPLLFSAEINAIKSEIENLSTQIHDYQELKTMTPEMIRGYSLEDLPNILIKARIINHLSQKELAEKIGIKEQQIQRYESQEYQGASLSRVNKIATILGLNNLEINKNQETTTTTSDNSDNTWVNHLFTSRKYPIKEIFKKGWFEEYTGSPDKLIDNSQELINSLFKQVDIEQIASLFKRRSMNIDKYDENAILAWEVRVIRRALAQNIETQFSPDLLTSEYISQLSTLSLRADGPSLVKQKLNEVGIAFIIESHLSKTYLDGAAILYSGLPIIGMTLRFDRLDNFWFVLFHELFHIANHLEKDKTEIIFDETEKINTTSIEIEANKFALNTLVPDDIWNSSLARFARTDKSLIHFAENNNLAIYCVAGRLRHEINDYKKFTHLVGNKKVRVLFPEIFPENEDG